MENQTNHLEHNPFPWGVQKSTLPTFVRFTFCTYHFFFSKLDVSYRCICFSLFLFFFFLSCQHTTKKQTKLRPYFKLLRWTTLPLTLSPRHSGVPRTPQGGGSLSVLLTLYKAGWGRLFSFCSFFFSSPDFSSFSCIFFIFMMHK